MRTEQLRLSQQYVSVGLRDLMEDKSAKCGKRHAEALEESLQVQKRLRQLVHEVLAAQEDERKRISHELQDEIAQALLGINVRLLALKQGSWNGINSLKNEIASAQRLVIQSARSVRRFARELDVNPPASGRLHQLVARSNRHSDEKKK